MTASPALAGRGHTWEFLGGGAFTVPGKDCGFKIRLAFPTSKEYVKTLKVAGGSRRWHRD